MNATNTEHSKQIEILNELWTEYGDDERFDYLFEMYDVGFPLAHVIAEKIVKSTPQAQEYIQITFNALLLTCNVEDTGFKTLDQIISPK
jgi:hypothetical protein